MKFGKNKMGDKKNAKPYLVKESKSEPRSRLRSGYKTAEKMAEIAAESQKGSENDDIQPSPERHHRKSNEKLIFDKMELARNYYWCDELDFYKMRSPVREILAFCNHVYTTEDILPDVFNFLARVKSAQRHGKRYMEYRVKFRFRSEWTP